MIEFEEYKKEIEKISALMIDAIQGKKVDIPFFEYYGPVKERNTKMIGKHGIYIFTVSEEIEVSREMINTYNSAKNWELRSVGATFNSLSPRTLKIGDVFYLGKVSGKSNSLYQRMNVHLEDITSSSTNGVKMRAEQRSFMNGKLDLHFFFPDAKYKNEPLAVALINSIESNLHKKLKPITGSSR